jgi:hypothetical protein
LNLINQDEISEEINSLREEIDSLDEESDAGKIAGLELELAEAVTSLSQFDDQAELDMLKELQSYCKGYAADWTSGTTLIRRTYFTEYCEELCKDIGDIPKNIPPYLVIDWEATAAKLEFDYTEVDYDGVEYLVR